jgi:DNA-binding NarL/FixJ family response regulator
MTTPLKTRILLADDHAVVRKGLRMVLDAEPDFQVVAEASDGSEALERGLGEDVHLAILDVSMPRLTGIQAARELARRKPDLRILILSMHDNERYFFEALRAGACTPTPSRRSSATTSSGRVTATCRPTIRSRRVSRRSSS